jgi:hypothetical protein
MNNVCVIYSVHLLNCTSTVDKMVVSLPRGQKGTSSQHCPPGVAKPAGTT